MGRIAVLGETVAARILVRQAIRDKFKDALAVEVAPDVGALGKMLQGGDHSHAICVLGEWDRNRRGELSQLISQYPKVVWVCIQAQTATPWPTAFTKQVGFKHQLRSEVPTQLEDTAQQNNLALELETLLQGIPQKAPKKRQGSLHTLFFSKPQAIIIASSTGGPDALEILLQDVKSSRIPIFIAQHMPPHFTRLLSQRLAKVSGLPCVEGSHGLPVEPGSIYIAPGDFHMSLNRTGNLVNIALDKDPLINSVRPAADKLLFSGAHVYGPHLHVFVLTGMGEDGKNGCLLVKEMGGTVAIQDKESSVVWGMPGAVYEAEAYDCVATLKECSDLLKSMCS